MALPFPSGSRTAPLGDAGRSSGRLSRDCGRGARAPASADAAAFPAEIRERVRQHPCYSEEAHGLFARMHVAVAPACNIQCNYCNRKFDCANESRPGVVSERLTPEQAEQRVVAAAAAMPNLSVVGIAGPGDALADWRRTADTVRRLRSRLPDMIVCLSTNGLQLLDHIADIRALGIDHVTVTLNALEPEIGAAIYDWVAFRGKRYVGREAAAVLIERQREGISALVAAGILVKINSVMIPGINDEHLAEVSRAMRREGVFLHNIMPLISDPAHGTRFGLEGRRGPSPAELTRLQDRLDGGARLMRHCRQCRADAVGLLGQDCAPAEPSAAETAAAPRVDPQPRDAYRAFASRAQEQQAQLVAEVDRRLAMVGPRAPMLFAVASKGGGRINQHFGKASEFLIFSASREGLTLSGVRRVDRYCRDGDGNDDALDAILAALDGVSVVLCAKVGDCPRRDLAAAGVAVDDSHAFEPIETAILRCVEMASAGSAAMSA